MELSRRYSNHVTQTDALGKALELVRAQPARHGGAGVSAALHRSGAPATGRARVDPSTAAAVYLRGSTVIELADLFGVSVSTIKRVLRDEGVRKHRQTSHTEYGASRV